MILWNLLDIILPIIITPFFGGLGWLLSNLVSNYYKDKRDAKDKATNYIVDRINIQIDKFDTWSMDHTLAMIIHPMLVQLYKTNHGYFHSDPEDVPEVGEGDKDEYGSDSKQYQRYCWIMEELIWTFDQIRDDEKEMQFHKDHKYDIEGHNKYNDRIQNGLRLFGKYFRGLWD